MLEGSFWIRLVLAVLATWRITHLLASEDGPADLVVRFRERLGSRWLGMLYEFSGKYPDQSIDARDAEALLRTPLFCRTH